MKFRITRTTVIEYEVNTNWYDSEIPQEMLEVDLEMCNEDPDTAFGHDFVSDEFVGEIIEE